MIKNIFKTIVIALLFISIVVVPLLGFHFYDFGYDSENKNWFAKWTTVSRSIFQENALLTNRQFGGGTTVYLSFNEDDIGNITEEDYQKASDIVKERLLSMGYSDTMTSVTEEKLIQVDFSEKSYVSATIGRAISIGNWTLNGSSSNEILCDETMVEDAYVTTPLTGGYGVEIKFTEEGAKKFASKVSTYAVTGSYMSLMMDGQYMAFPTISSADIGDTFTLTTYNAYSDASMLATIIKYGSLPAELMVDRSAPLPAKITGGALAGIIIGVAVIILACIALVLIKGKKYGIFAVLALISDVAILMTSVANGYVMLNITTLVSFVLFLILATLIFAYALDKAQNGGWKALVKANMKCVWTHAALFALSLILYLTVQGSFAYVVRALMLFTCANFVLYFAFIVFGIHTLVEMDKAKSEN